MTHIVDAIAEKFRELLTDATDAQGRVTRDRITPVEARSDLPWIDVKIGEEKEIPQVHSFWRAQVEMIVDIKVADADENVSHTLQELRAQAYRAIMNQSITWPPGCIRVQPAVAGEVLRGESGSTSVAAQRTPFTVWYQHSLADPTQ